MHENIDDTDIDVEIDQAYYIVTQLIKGSLTNRSVWVDSWPTYSVVVVSDNQDDFIVLTHDEHCSSQEGLRSGVLDQLLSYRSAAYRNCVSWDVRNFSVKDAFKSSIPEGFMVTTLKQEHVETVVQEWPYSGTFSDCKEWICDMMKQFPSVCIENEHGKPIAWVLQQDYGYIGMLHVVPEYRRAKLGSARAATVKRRFTGNADPVLARITVTVFLSFPRYTIAVFDRGKDCDRDDTATV
uniref:Glycine N-acyltransferase-like protein n=1 Tax=Magallana gigas TaxID=29159 RepID=K1R0V7_MAGGI